MIKYIKRFFATLISKNCYVMKQFVNQNRKKELWKIIILLLLFEKNY